MSDPDGYRDGTALWTAAVARAKTTATQRGVEPASVLRGFVFDRFLARVFTRLDGPWVLKGGNAVLARVSDARATKDLDLLNELDDLDSAVAALRRLLDVDLGDHFRFVVTTVNTSLGGTGQPAVDGYRVSIDAYCGAKKRGSFHVDLVTGSLMTDVAEVAPSTAGLEVPGLSAPQVRLYPVVDHIADKLCATQAKYGGNLDKPSSRVRDLVDLVVFARTQQVDGTALWHAIGSEWAHRGLPGQPELAPPAQWDRGYPRIARDVPACGPYTTFESAVGLVRTFLAPALDGTARGRRWSPETATWSVIGR